MNMFATAMPQRSRNLELALLLSLMLHAALLAVRFMPPVHVQRIFKDTPLEVILVNATTVGQQAPEKPQAVAQTSLAGGGDATLNLRSSSPLPYAPSSSAGDDFEDRQRRIQALQHQQEMLLTQVRQQLASLPEFDPRDAPSTSAQDDQQEEMRQRLLKLLAEIEKQIQEDSAQPKKRYISPATREEVFALYYDALRRKVEDKGTQNFPEHNGRKLYGELVMILTVNHDGRILQAEIVQSSGQLLLDRRAQAIAYAAGPYGEFSSAMRAQADQIAVVARFSFTHEGTGTLKTSVQ